MLRHGALLLLLLVAGLVVVAVNVRSQDKIADETTTDAEKTNVQVLMREKLTHMQKALDGMVTENFETIAAEAEMLRIIGRAASWQAIDTVEYRIHSKRYAALTSNLNQAAQSRNRDAVLLQYLQLNISCVDCHQYIRARERKRRSRMQN